MKKVAVITGTRAEYGLLKPLIQKLGECKEIDVKLIVTGSHLSYEFGYTADEIEKDGFKIDKKIDILMSSDRASGIAKAMGLAMISLGKYFEENRLDLIVVLGDRYEILAAVSAAVVSGIPVAHLHGGEITEGAYDEYFRHAITKMSTLHFTSCEAYRKRVIQLGEEPNRVYNVGALGVENIRGLTLLEKSDLQRQMNINLERPYGMVTFHPVTLEKEHRLTQITHLLEALKTYKDMNFIFTKANADEGGRAINQMIDDYIVHHPSQAVAFDSMGVLRYLSAMKYSSLVIGNSSSGIIEAPSFGIPTIDIGNRQRGRIQADSVIHCEPIKEEIIKAIEKARSELFLETLKTVQNPYGEGKTSEQIVRVIKQFLEEYKGGIIKKFYSLNIINHKGEIV